MDTSDDASSQAQIEQLVDEVHNWSASAHCASAFLAVSELLRKRNPGLKRLSSQQFTALFEQAKQLSANTTSDNRTLVTLTEQYLNDIKEKDDLIQLEFRVAESPKIPLGHARLSERKDDNNQTIITISISSFDAYRDDDNWDKKLVDQKDELRLTFAHELFHILARNIAEYGALQGGNREDNARKFARLLVDARNKRAKAVMSAREE